MPKRKALFSGVFSMFSAKRFFSLKFIVKRIRDKGFAWCIKRFFQKVLFRIKLYRAKIKDKFTLYADNIRSLIMPAQAYADSLLAIYDFRVSPYAFHVYDFLARTEVSRVKNSLSYIDVVFVVDKEKKTRGDQPEVTESNYRNWILNLAECTDLLSSVSSVSIFDNKHKFLNFYQKARYTHKVFPEEKLFYRPQRCYLIKTYITDYYKATGFVPRFKSSGILLRWAEEYFLKNSYPLLPIVMFVRNMKFQPARNTNWPVWTDFFRDFTNKYPVKFFIVNDFWDPFTVPPDLAAKVVICAEATVSVKYRAALTQRCAFVATTGVGSFTYCFFTDTPYIFFGMINEYYSVQRSKDLLGINDDLSFPWATKYQKTYSHGVEDKEYIMSKFEEMYALLDKDGCLIPEYFSKADQELKAYK